MARIAKKDLPAYVRRCYEQWKKANLRNREAEIERLKFYVGGDHQWREEEIQKRKNSQRPWMTINRCKPAVDQIEGDIRLNPPGPQCHPVGDGADKDTADIIEGLIREVEYRSGAKTAYSTAGKYCAASGYGAMELVTEYVSERDMAQQLRINSIEDPAMVFFDPTARMANRQDAAWAGKIRMYSKLAYMAEFGDDRRILKPRGIQAAMGWIQEAIGINADLAQINEWTGAGDGPFFVCEFYLAEVDEDKLTIWSDNVGRFKDDPVPDGLYELSSRMVPRRSITKYLVDAFETLAETEWLGTLIPLFPVLGPEVYIDGKLHRLSLISQAIDPQRGLNYTATTATELAGALPKSPWIGWEGQFDDPKWQTANSEMWAYLEVKPTFATDTTTGAQSLLPAPQRNNWEAPIQWLLALSSYFAESIKAVTSIYDPGLGRNKGDQSGKAIEQLRAESNVGNYSYMDNLHRAIEIMYQQMCVILPKIMDGPRVATIVRPDSQHELVEINRDFTATNGIDPKTGAKGKPNNICLGQYSVRVTAGPDFQTRSKEAVATLNEFFRAAPQVLQAPGIAAMFLRLVGDGNPQLEQMADLLAPNQGGESSPEEAQQQIAQMQQQNQVLTALVQKMQAELQAKLPEIEAKKWVAAVQALTSIRTAEIKAGIDQSAQDVRTLEHLTALAHDAAKQAAEHEHARGMQESISQGEDPDAQPVG